MGENPPISGDATQGGESRAEFVPRPVTLDPWDLADERLVALEHRLSRVTTWLFALTALVVALGVAGGAVLAFDTPAQSSLGGSTPNTSPASTPAGSARSTTADYWGAFFGQAKPIDQTLLPTPITLPDPVAQVATSNSTAYALLTNGSLYAWGQGGNGQLGIGTTANSLTVPVRVQFPAGVTIARLPTDVMPFNTGLALDTRGRAWGWGLNRFGVLCQGNAEEYLTPVEIPLPDVTALAGAGDHALYDSHATLYACGDNKYGDLGDGSGLPAYHPRAIPVSSTRSPVVVLVASCFDSGALLANGHYYDWGYDGQGQLGDGLLGVAASVPVKVRLSSRVIRVAQGGSDIDNGQTLVMLSNHSLWAWGDDQFGQLGDHQTATEVSPIEFRPPSGVTYRQLATGGNTSYAVSTTGALYSWGGNQDGQVGDGTIGPAFNPVLVTTDVSGISATAFDVVASLQT